MEAQAMLSKLFNMTLRLAGAVCAGGAVFVCVFYPALSAAAAGEELVLVEDGVSKAPIIIFADAPQLTRQSADELAHYIEKTSGARPEVLEGRPDPLPDKAIWVGYQPVLEKLFPDQDFDFKHPEEILIAANASHLVIAGRDRWDPDQEPMDVRFAPVTVELQQEYGTHNAVYTFLHDYLGVRWLWPDDIGEDILEQKTVAFEPFSYSYYPQVRARGGIFPWYVLHRVGPGGPDNLTSGGYWLRAQRLQLCEFPSPHGHGFPHGFGEGFNWRDRFYETRPDFFALQPDGSRGGGKMPYPSEGNLKMCQSNPDLAAQWLDDVAARLEENPNQRVFNASPSDGYHSGHCVCENCLAWDHPDAEPRRLVWQGLSQTYLALSDRDVTFANRLARGLKERFPDRDLYVYMLAYGHSCPPPVEAVPEDNVIIGNVSNFLLRSDSINRNSSVGGRPRDYFAQWGQITKLNFWRPNVGAPVGWQWGLPDVPLQRTIKDMQFAAEHNWMGIYVDFVREIWSNQGPMYYLMAQLTWNPHQDGQAILDDYYRRAFGPAAAEMEAYWTYLEKIREECYGTEKPGVSDHDILDFYDAARLDTAQEKLDQARAQAADGPEVYRRRIAFVQAGLDFTRLITGCGRLVREYNRYGASDDIRERARAQIHANWEKLRALRDEHPRAVRWRLFFKGYRADGAPQTPRYAPTLWVP